MGGKTNNIFVNMAYRSLVDAYFLNTGGLGYLNGSIAVFYPDLAYFCGDVLRLNSSIQTKTGCFPVIHINLGL